MRQRTAPNDSLSVAQISCLKRPALAGSRSSAHKDKTYETK